MKVAAETLSWATFIYVEWRNNNTGKARLIIILSTPTGELIAYRSDGKYFA